MSRMLLGNIEHSEMLRMLGPCQGALLWASFWSGFRDGGLMRADVVVVFECLIEFRKPVGCHRAVH